EATKSRGRYFWKARGLAVRRMLSWSKLALVRASAASSWRCGHATSFGGTATNSGPGNRPRLPMPDWLIASCAAISPMRSHSDGPQNGSTVTKSTVPAMRGLSPSVSKRLIVRMPDSPAVSLRPLSSRPAPSEVAVPMPVTTPTGGPALSCVPLMLISSSSHRLDQCEAFAAPMADAGDRHLSGRRFHILFHTGFVAQRIEHAVPERERCERDVHDELRLRCVPDITAGRAHGNPGQLCEKGALVGGRRLRTARPGKHRVMAGLKQGRDLLPQRVQRLRHRAGLAIATVGSRSGKPRERLGVALFGVRALLDHEERAERSGRK